METSEIQLLSHKCLFAPSFYRGWRTSGILASALKSTPTKLLTHRACLDYHRPVFSHESKKAYPWMIWIPFLISGTFTLREDYLFFKIMCKEQTVQGKKIMVASVALHPGASILALSYFKRSAILYVKVLAAPSIWSERSLTSTPVTRFKPLCKQV